MRNRTLDSAEHAIYSCNINGMSSALVWRRLWRPPRREAYEGPQYAKAMGNMMRDPVFKLMHIPIK